MFARESTMRTLTTDAPERTSRARYPLSRRDQQGRRADRANRPVEVRQDHGELLPGQTGRGTVGARLPFPVPRGAVHPGEPCPGRGWRVRPAPAVWLVPGRGRGRGTRGTAGAAPLQPVAVDLGPDD